MKHQELDIIILGSGTCIPTRHRGPSGIVLKSNDVLLLIDGGSGTLSRMTSADIDYKSLQYIFYSHLHPDHCIELIPLLQALKVSPPTNPHHELHIVGPPGFLDFINNLERTFGTWIKNSSGFVKYYEAFNTSNTYDFGIVVTKPMNHSSYSNGYRFEINGKTIAYSGDTDYCQEVIDLGRKADILILECSLPDDEKIDGHLGPSLAGKIAQQAGCDHLILTHFYPSIENVDILSIVQHYYTGDISLAFDGITIKL